MGALAFHRFGDRRALVLAQRLHGQLGVPEVDLVHGLRGTGQGHGREQAEVELWNVPCLSGYHPHPLYVVSLLGLQVRAAAGALRRRSG